MRKTIKTALTVITMLAAGLCSYGQSGFRPWYDHHVNSINRLPARATSYSYESEQDALALDRNASCIMILALLLYRRI